MENKTPSSGRRRRDSGQIPVSPPTDVPGYELNRFIGSGAYGEVWVGIDTTTGRNVAIKFFARTGNLDGSGLAREVEKLVALSADRYVVQLLDVGWEASPPYYVMEYIPNGSLDDRLREGVPISVGEAVEIFRDVAIGLSHAHAKGIIHCDIKPANVLLDQDSKPRLADFGQARLMYERSPTLGTLYFMAPEQADSTAMPDSRWDIYGLGALLYSMLTRIPPHRTEERVDELRSATRIEERLRLYQAQLNHLPPPELHRDVAAVDRALADIVDRCLAANPDERFHSVDAVLQALDDRERAHTRRPLLLLGLVGPLLLLLTAGIFGYRGYLRAMNESTELAKQGMADSNLWAAESTAKLVANELDKRFAALQSVATDAQLIDHLNHAISDTDFSSAIAFVAGPPVDPETNRRLRQQILQSDARRGLQAHMIGTLNDEKLPYAASWFVTSNRGTMLAAAFHAKPESDPVGDNFSYRTYFHGGPRDLAISERIAEPLGESQLSALFQSTATKTWKVAISQPIKDGDQTIGVVAMTVELGDFVRFRTSPDRCALLVDARVGDHRGVVLQHPLFERVLASERQLPERFASHVVDVDQLAQGTPVEYLDPFAGDILGRDFAGSWLACAASVEIESLVRDGPVGNDVTSNKRETGLMLIVQQRLNTAIEPVINLGQRLLREGLTALAIIIGVTSLLWLFVVQMMRSQHRPTNQTSETPEEDHYLHSRETLPSPGVGASRTDA